ncbi:hypothetical protein PQQ87_08310 [Paraburkholderia nemoris]|uniref:hypothetical protein n=1 Tax=Paraburkholderia nemoris TaxID=2793076 RepID=UPI0038B83707
MRQRLLFNIATALIIACWIATACVVLAIGYHVYKDFELHTINYAYSEHVSIGNGDSKQ